MPMSPKQLLDLPDEVLNFVAEAVDNLNSLHALARTCTRFQDHAEKFIYRSLTIEHGAQAQALHKAITARPRRATMASKLTVAPSMVATRGIEHIPSMLEKMNCVKDLFIESPFCKKPSCSEFVEDQERYANIFRKSSLDIVDPSARLLSQLVSCTLHFTGYHSRIATVDRELSFVFLHPNLRNLTISCARIDGAELEHLKSRPQRTPLSSLFLDQCDVSASGLTTVLSIPASLKSLKFFEVSRQGPQIHSLDYSPALLKALSLQKHSLESLCLSLRSPKLSPFTREFDMSSFLALRVLMIRCQRLTESVYPTSLKWATYTPPALDTLVFSGIDFQSRRNDIAFPSELQACLKTLDPSDLCKLARSVCLSLQSGSEVRAGARKSIEELGDHFRRASSHSSRPALSQSTCRNRGSRDGPRLRVSRLTRGRGPKPPYLYHEYEPEELPLYDSSCKGSGWLNVRERDSRTSAFPHIEQHFHLDFSGLETSDVLNDFDFDSFLNSDPVGPPDLNFFIASHDFQHFDQPLLATTAPGTDLTAHHGLLDLNPLFATASTQSNQQVQDEAETDSVD